MEKNILILCCGYPYQTDKGFGYRVSKVLEEMELPQNVELMEVGESASMMPSVIAEKKKVLIIDVFQTSDSPGTIVRLKPEEVPVTVNGLTDIPKRHLMDTLEHLAIIGMLPEIIFIGVVPKDIQTERQIPYLTPEIEEQVPQVVSLILKEI